MIDKNLISKLTSLVISVTAIFLFIYFLPEIITLIGILTILIIIGVFALKFFIRQRVIKMNFAFKNNPKYQDNYNNIDDESHQMKDVTNTKSNP